MKGKTKISTKIAIMAVFLVSVCTVSLFAQETAAIEEDTREKPNSIFSSDDGITLSGYGAPVVKYTKTGDMYGWMVGGRGGLIINENWVIGGAGYGLVYPTKRREVAGSYTGDKPNLHMGYGGAMLEYYFFPKSVVHLSAGVVVGAGGLGVVADNEDYERGGDAFFVVEPEVNLFVNLTRFARIGVGGSYRYVHGVGTEGLSDSDFRGFSGQVICAFGWF
ncbi:MAG: hypothetical protein GY754_11975 [bacterium]|nr:hypothetical protein [bacterium]